MKPLDEALWNKCKRRAYKLYDKPSAYRSGAIVKFYKEAGGKFARESTKLDARPLARWFKEEWTNQRGAVGYEKKGDIYRPSKRVTQRTPKTWHELPARRVRSASREKATKGRIKRF